MTEAIENQVERFAPGFRDTVVERVTKNAVQMEQWNPNHVGGDISNGEASFPQMLARPVPGGTPTRRRSAGSTSPRPRPRRGPPCTDSAADNAARVALREVFGVRDAPPLRPAQR